jgi:ribosome-associated protein
VETTVELTTPSIPLAGLLKLAGVADSGGHAKHLVQAGLVRVNGHAELRRGAQIRSGDVVVVDTDPPAHILVA